MTRKLLNFGLAWLFVLGCWGGVLAAVACPHAGCETGASEPAVGGAVGHDHAAVTSEDHSGHNAEHGGHATEAPARNLGGLGPVGLPNIRPGGHDLGCTHCVGRPGAPSAPNFEVQAKTARKAGESAAPASPARVEAPAAVSLREITPAQHAPPGRTVRHILLNVFRI